MLRKWREKTWYAMHTVPSTHYNLRILHKYYDLWRVMRPWRRLYFIHSSRGRQGNAIMRRAFKAWRIAQIIKVRCLRASGILNKLLRRRSLKWSFIKWPGFIAWKRASIFHEKQKRRSRRRAVLVEVPDPSQQYKERRALERAKEKAKLLDDFEDDEFPTTPTRGYRDPDALPIASAHGYVDGQTKHKGDIAIASFVQRRNRLPLLQRAALMGYFDHIDSVQISAEGQVGYAGNVAVGLGKYNYKEGRSTTLSYNENRFDSATNSSRSVNGQVDDPRGMLETMLITVLHSWLDAARKERRCREMARKVRFLRDTRLMYISILLWAKTCCITAHRSATWVGARRGMMRRPLDPSFNPFEKIPIHLQSDDDMMKWFDEWEVNRKQNERKKVSMI
jgi:hypothetical protein